MYVIILLPCLKIETCYCLSVGGLHSDKTNQKSHILCNAES
uniref:Uncharacterized protein n=1 Tax=Anguilla anguilla TaxID=7936 RepID=A0A0E9QFB5_ANGAN